ncbi:MAG: hypothetical protein AB9888_15405 [Bacteroidales bacterium]
MISSIYPGPNVEYRPQKNTIWEDICYKPDKTKGVWLDPNIKISDGNINEITLGLRIKSELAYFESYNRTPIHLGALNTETENEVYKIPVDEWVQNKQYTAVRELLFYAPYWIEQLANATENIAGIKSRSVGRVLLVYRLTEICLRVIDQWERDRTNFTSTKALLIRQRYRYLLRMYWLKDHGEEEEKETITECVANLDTIIRKARSEYVNLLLENTDHIELALNEAIPSFSRSTSLKSEWNLDDEVDLLLYQFLPTGNKSKKLLSFAWEYPSDQILTDLIMRQWMLARDNIPGVTRAISSVLISPQKEEEKELEPGWFVKSVSWFFNKIHALIIGGAILCLVGLFLEDIQIMVGAVFLGLMFPGLILLLTGLLGRFPWEAQIFYPLALRVPAMGAVGILAVAGLADAYITFGFAAFSAEQTPAAILLLIGCLVPSWFYIRFEVNSRRVIRKYANKRSWLIFLYCTATSIWLGTFTALLADPLKLTENVNLLPPFLTTPFGYRISFSSVVIISALALLVGVFTQIFWEDKAIAEPL